MPSKVKIFNSFKVVSSNPLNTSPLYLIFEQLHIWANRITLRLRVWDVTIFVPHNGSLCYGLRKIKSDENMVRLMCKVKEKNTNSGEKLTCDFKGCGSEYV